MMAMTMMMTLKMMPNWAGVFRQSQALLEHHLPSSPSASRLVSPSRTSACLTWGGSGDMVFDLRCRMTSLGCLAG